MFVTRSSAVDNIKQKCYEQILRYSTSLQPGSCALGTFIENKGARPSPDHSWWASSLGQGQVDVRVEESWVAVSFHQAVDFILRSIKAGLSCLKDVLLDRGLGWVVNVDLSGKVCIYYQNEIALDHAVWWKTQYLKLCKMKKDVVTGTTQFDRKRSSDQHAKCPTTVCFVIRWHLGMG